MKRKFCWSFTTWLLAALFFVSCGSINRSAKELDWPPSLVYFSFDDGPNPLDDTTERVLEVLAKYKIRALFFLIGENAEHAPHLVRRIYDAGHYIGNHGYSEKLSYKMNAETFRDNLLRGEAAITAALGKELRPKLYRPHGGWYTSRQEEIWRGEGYVLVPGVIRVYDAVMSRAERDKMIRRVIEKVERQGGGLVLLHDGRDSFLRMKKKAEKSPKSEYNRSWIPDALEEILRALEQKGYVFNGPDYLKLYNN